MPTSVNPTGKRRVKVKRAILEGKSNKEIAVAGGYAPLSATGTFLKKSFANEITEALERNDATLDLDAKTIHDAHFADKLVNDFSAGASYKVPDWQARLGSVDRSFKARGIGIESEKAQIQVNIIDKGFLDGYIKYRKEKGKEQPSNLHRD